jgi:hypothetical protein
MSGEMTDFVPRQELTQLLKGSTGQSLDGTEVTDQSRSDRFLTDKQRQILHPR